MSQQLPLFKPVRPTSFTAESYAALCAAKTGDWQAADAIELQFLDDPANEIRPFRGEGSTFEEFEDAQAMKIIKTPDDGLHVLWNVTEDETFFNVITNIDGRIIEEEE